MAYGDGGIRTKRGWLWVRYSHHGVEHSEPARDKKGAKTKDLKIAQEYLKAITDRKAAERLAGLPFATPAMRHKRVNDLIDIQQADHKLRGKKLSPQNASYVKQVRADFGDMLTANITPELIDNYIQEKLAADYRPASINRRLQVLSRSFKLAVKRGTLTKAPYIRKLSEKGNERQGFFSEAELAAVILHLPADLQDYVRFAAATGMRKSAIASLTWADIDGDVLTLKGENSKNGEPVNIPLDGELGEIIARRKAVRRIVRDGLPTTELCEWIFHRNGEPVREFRKSWKTATRAAKVSGRLFHDLRRFAVRNLIRAGNAQKVAMEISGHKTASVFDRYNIIDTSDVRRALARTEQYRKRVSK